MHTNGAGVDFAVEAVGVWMCLSVSKFLNRAAALIPPMPSIGTATLGCWRLTRRGARRWWCRPAGSWGRGAKHPGQRQCAQILAPRGQDTRRDICGHSCWRVSTGCFHSSVAGAHAPDWVHHRAGDGAEDTETCRRANKYTGNRSGALPAAGYEDWAVAGCSRSQA